MVLNAVGRKYNFLQQADGVVILFILAASAPTWCLIQIEPYCFKGGSVACGLRLGFELGMSGDPRTRNGGGLEMVEAGS